MSERLRQFERVGVGGMAEVYRGAIQGERGTTREVAIKRLKPELKEDPAAVELFVREAQVSLSLNHPHVVHSLELIRDEAGYALVCEWLACASLEELCHRVGPLPANAVAYVGQTLLGALSYVHESALGGAGLVHRDVTPANVLVTADGQVKLGDFGVAECAASSALVTVKSAGTPEYAAPEQLAGGPVDARTDLFGLGKTLSAVAAELPPALTTVIAKACAESPEARYASAEQMGAAWMQASATVSEPASSETLRLLIATAGGLPASPAAPRLDDHVSSYLKEALEPGAITALPTTPEAPRRTRLLALLTTFAGLVVVGLWVGLARTNDLPVEPTPPPAALASEPVESAPLPIQVREPTPVSEPVPRRVPPARRNGSVSLNAVPWASVELEGRTLGNTPLKGVELIEGRHVLLLVNPAQGLRREVVVDVTPGARQTFLVDLRRGTVDKRTDPN